jgi:hypothetical protein
MYEAAATLTLEYVDNEQTCKKMSLTNEPVTV